MIYDFILHIVWCYDINYFILATKYIYFISNNIFFSSKKMPVEKCDKRITKIVKETDILILGSGLAGLGAAYELKSNKLNYIVLEAQSVPGGRIRSQLMHNSKVICNDKDPKNIVNSGAQWLHGRENLLYKIADEYDLLHSELSEEGLGTYIRNDGFRINDFLVKKVDFIVGQILEECEELTHNSSSEYPPSVGTYLITEFEKRLHLFQSDDDKNIAKQLLDWHIRFQIIDNSCSSVDQISAKSWGSYSFNGESCQAHINFKKSFYDIVDELVDKIGPKNIVLNTEVETIYWSGQFYIPTNNPSDDPKVFVKCKNGDIYIAKTAICTFSLGVLKASIDSLFYPKLPKRYQDAITKLGFGTINKIFLRFENSWWNTSKGFQLIYEFSDYKVLKLNRSINLNCNKKNLLYRILIGQGLYQGLM